MAEAEFHQVLLIDRDKLFQAITSYENYPKFVEGCTGVQVERKGPGQAKVTYRVSMMKDIVYTLEMTEDNAAGVVRWSLVDSDFFKKNNGVWELKEAGPGKTDVRYKLDVEFKISVPGFILNRMVKGNLPGMVKSFEKQARSLA
jgi:ribosome-associated toxin RatA of RatAB toxin-antitoxin module